MNQVLNQVEWAKD